MQHPLRPLGRSFALALLPWLSLAAAPASAQCVDDPAAPPASPAPPVARVAPPERLDAVGLPRLNAPAPDFDAPSTHGRLRLADYRGRWLVLFSHPGDFTPVCTTEFLGFARAHADFQALDTELLGLSIDGKYAHIAWMRDIEARFGVTIPFPILEDLSMRVARAYGMVHPAASDTSTVRALFVIDPEGILRAMLYYPMSNGRSVDEVLRLVRALRTTDAQGVATPEGWRPGADVIVPPPATAAAAAERAESGCAAWYLCTKPLEEAPAGARSPTEPAGGHGAFVSQELEPYACGSIQRLHTQGGVFLASQPEPADFEQAKLGGVKTVVNQRHASELAFDERALVEDLGMTYLNPAWNGVDELTDEVLDHTRELLRTAERPLLLHCSSGNRVGAVWLAYRVLDEGLDLGAAQEEAARVGLRSTAYAERVLDYVARRRAESARATPGLDAATREALLAALDDERRSRASYAAVIARHGSLRPFANVVRAESRHEQHLLDLFAAHGLAVPPDPWRDGAPEAPDSVGDACRAAIEAERANVALYDRLLAEVTAPDVRDTFRVLRAASALHHLPAFERCGGRRVDG